MPRPLEFESPPTRASRGDRRESSPNGEVERPQLLHRRAPRNRRRVAGKPPGDTRRRGASAEIACGESNGYPAFKSHAGASSQRTAWHAAAPEVRARRISLQAAFARPPEDATARSKNDCERRALWGFPPQVIPLLECSTDESSRRTNTEAVRRPSSRNITTRRFTPRRCWRSPLIYTAF